MMKIHRAGMRGFSVLELSIAVAIVGVAVVTVLITITDRARDDQQQQARHRLAAAKAALASFAFVHSRLPCPSHTTDGREDCDGAASGYLPYATLGLADRAAGEIGYELGSANLATVGGGQAVSVMAPTDAGVQAWPRYSAGDVVLTKLVDRSVYDGKIDFCAALEQGPLDRAVASMTVTTTEGLPIGAGVARDVLTSASASGQLGCAGLLSAAARSHFDTALAAAAMSNSFVDYKAQFDVAYDLYLWDLSTGVWSFADATAGLTKQGTKTVLATAAWLESNLMNPAPVLSLAGLGASVLTYLRASSNLARFSYNMALAHQNRELFADVNDSLFVAHAEIQANAVLDAQLGSVVGYQGMHPPTPPTSPGTAAYDGSNPLGQTAKDFMAAVGP